ncbi:MAG: T9SS type A sorting domain-containing protein [Bacteroidetes bacterium]|nr:T9SS type A sorting domain-containing protein [Bacteroidota bacterium]
MYYITIYPNPASTVVNLRADKFIGTGSIIVTDLFGKQFKQQALSLGTNTIDVSALSKGVYFVTVVTSEGRKTEKLIVE